MGCSRDAVVTIAVEHRLLCHSCQGRGSSPACEALQLLCSPWSSLIPFLSASSLSCTCWSHTRKPLHCSTHGVAELPFHISISGMLESSTSSPCSVTTALCPVPSHRYSWLALHSLPLGPFFTTILLIQAATSLLAFSFSSLEFLRTGGPQGYRGTGQQGMAPGLEGVGSLLCHLQEGPRGMCWSRAAQRGGSAATIPAAIKSSAFAVIAARR